MLLVGSYVPKMKGLLENNYANTLWIQDRYWGLPGSNQDYFDFANNSFNNYIAIVCDGMGGHQHGEVASKMAVDSLVAHFKRTNFNNLTDEEINK